MVKIQNIMCTSQSLQETKCWTSTNAQMWHVNITAPKPTRDTTVPYATTNLKNQGVCTDTLKRCTLASKLSSMKVRFLNSYGVVVKVAGHQQTMPVLQSQWISWIHSDEGLTLETSVFESFTVANLPY